MLELLYLVVGAFVADVYCAEDSSIVNSGFWASKQLCRILGFLTADKTGQIPSVPLTLLGAEVLLTVSEIQAGAIQGRISKLRDHIADVLRLNFLTPAEASELRCRLGFCTSLLMGKLGRCMMIPLIRRQYSSRTTGLTRTLRRCLVWWHSAAGPLPPRVAPFRLPPPFGAHSDAQGLGHIACRILLGSVSSYRVHLPPWFAHLETNAEGESAIYLFEICDAILTVAVISTANTQPSRTCVLRIDNQAA